MKKFGYILLVLALSACGRDQHSQAQAEAGSAAMPQPAATSMSTSTSTGRPGPVYPRAHPVALPVEPSALAQKAPMTNSAPVEATTTSTATEVPPTPTPTPTPTILSTEKSVVVLQTSFGRIVLELADFAAPKTCENFRTLVASGFYNGTIFHRVIPFFIIQGGDPNTKTSNRATYGQGNPGYTLPPEIKLHHDRGAVAMARLPDATNPQRNSNGSQFYICLAPSPSLDDQYTVFAHVIQGMDVAERIAGAPRDNRDDPLERITMEARLESKEQALQEGSTGASH